MDVEFAIVAVAYNRERSLARLLRSLNLLIVPPELKIPLIISVDGGSNPATRQAAEDFNWKHGDKQLLFHETNLGLEKHIFTCMELSNEYSNVVILEDDCYLSRFSFNFIVQSIKLFSASENVCGISLYSFDINEFARMPFLPIEDGFDNYFMKVPSSYGQIISSKMWNDFKRSLEERACEVQKSDPLPDEVLSWDKSWKRHFFKYMLAANKYFLFPRIALTTNFCDAGVHFPSADKRYQVSLLNGEKEYRLSKLSESGSTYDCYLELENRNLPDLSKYENLQMDLYGLKNPEKYKDSYFITSKEILDRPEHTYGFEMWPHDLNVIHNIPGDHFQLAKAGQITSSSLKQKELSSPIIAKIRESSAFLQLRKELETSLKKSLTYRIGNLVTAIPRYIKQKLSGG